MRSKTASIVLAALVTLSLCACKVTKTQQGEAPKVDVKGGQLPKYDVQPAQVEVSSTPTEVTVPKVEVSKEKTTVNVPHVDIKSPSSTPTPQPQ
jgi:hypothetical protein